MRHLDQGGQTLALGQTQPEPGFVGNTVLGPSHAIYFRIVWGCPARSPHLSHFLGILSEILCQCRWQGVGLIFHNLCSP